MTKNDYTSTFTEMNVHCQDKPVVTNTIYYDTSYFDEGSTCAQLFVGTN